MFCEWWGQLPKPTKISEESPGPRRSSVFLLFQVIFTILVADDDESVQIQKPRNWSLTKKHQKTRKPKPLKKVLGPNIPENPLGFLFCQIFFVFLKCFGFFAILVAEKNIIRIQKKKSETKKTKTTKNSSLDTNILRIFGSFGVSQVFLCFLQS